MRPDGIADEPESNAETGEDGTAVAAVQRLTKPALPKRFYTEATVGEHETGFTVLLDGRMTRTPARKILAVGNRGIADALAAEWNAQSVEINPAAMPLTRLVNSALDRVFDQMAAVREDIVRHAGSDLILYRAEGPRSLIEAEDRAWTPILARSERALQTRFILAEGIVHVAQHPATLAAVADAVASFEALPLAALHTMTTLTGSALIALAFARGDLSAEAAWDAAHVDEDWQASHWGRDEQAFAERALRWREMQAAATVLAAR